MNNENLKPVPEALKRQCVLCEENLQNFFCKLHIVSPARAPASIIFRVLPQFCAEYAPKPIDDDLPKRLTDLFDKTWSTKSLSEIRDKCKEMSVQLKSPYFKF